MSEAIPESIPTSSLRSGRPAKRARVTDASSKQSSQIDALFANPDRQLETATGPKAKNLALPPELVANVQGSSAGAGSGEFHVYKASRRREYERLRVMDEEVEKEKADRDWETQREEAKRKDDEKLSKNRARRAKLKARQNKGKSGDGEINGNNTMENGGGKEQTGSGASKKKLVPAKASIPTHGGQSGVDSQDPDGADLPEETGITIHEDD